MESRGAMGGPRLRHRIDGLPAHARRGHSGQLAPSGIDGSTAIAPCLHCPRPVADALSSPEQVQAALGWPDPPRPAAPPPAGNAGELHDGVRSRKHPTFRPPGRASKPGYGSVHGRSRAVRVGQHDRRPPTSALRSALQVDVAALGAHDAPRDGEPEIVLSVHSLAEHGATMPPADSVPRRGRQIREVHGSFRYLNTPYPARRRAPSTTCSTGMICRFSHFV